MQNTNIPFLNTVAITPLGAAPAGVAQQCQRCDNSSSKVCLYNFVTLGGGRPWNEECVVPLFLSYNLGRAAKNYGGQEVRVHDMRKLWSPHDLHMTRQ